MARLSRAPAIIVRQPLHTCRSPDEDIEAVALMSRGDLIRISDLIGDMVIALASENGWMDVGCKQVRGQIRQSGAGPSVAGTEFQSRLKAAGAQELRHKAKCFVAELVNAVAHRRHDTHEGLRRYPEKTLRCSRVYGGGGESAIARTGIIACRDPLGACPRGAWDAA